MARIRHDTGTESVWMVRGAAIVFCRRSSLVRGMRRTHPTPSRRL